MIIIGILAAIAIPTFLAQRERAWNSTATSDVRNAATHAEAISTDAGGSYASVNSTALTNEGFQTSDGVTGLAAGGNATNFAVEVTSQSGDTCRYVKSASPQVGCGTSAPAVPTGITMS